MEEQDGRGGGNNNIFFNTVLIRQDKKFFTFDLFKVIQDAILLILHCRMVY